MKKIKEFIGGLWKIYIFFWFTLLLLILYPIYLLFLLNEKHFHKGFKLLRAHTGFLMYISGIFTSVKNKHYLKKGQAYVYAPNHSSYLDIVILYQTFSEYFVFMGKEELAKVPVFNIFFKKMNITVNRKSSMSGKRAMDRCANELDKGHSVVLFPEGTIPDNAPILGRFKAGAFKLAIDKQVPIVPITMTSNYKRLEMKGLFSGKASPGIAKVIIHEPIPTLGMKEEDIPSLQEKVFDIIKTQLKESGLYKH
tara:strand:+ start:1322 stop:2077 length:756 start_codon:yes stop_codon:yes gene_type:complete